MTAKLRFTECLRLVRIPGSGDVNSHTLQSGDRLDWLPHPTVRGGAASGKTFKRSPIFEGQTIARIYHTQRWLRVSRQSRSWAKAPSPQKVRKGEGISGGDFLAHQLAFACTETAIRCLTDHNGRSVLECECRWLPS